MTTAISEVIANQSSVCQTSFAAFCSVARLAIEATIAVKTSGGTSARRSWTKIEPIVWRVTVSQLALPAASTPMLRAMRPSSRPMTMAVRTWKPKEAKNGFGEDLAVAWDTSCTLIGWQRPKFWAMAAASARKIVECPVRGKKLFGSKTTQSGIISPAKFPWGCPNAQPRPGQRRWPAQAACAAARSDFSARSVCPCSRVTQWPAIFDALSVPGIRRLIPLSASASKISSLASGAKEILFLYKYYG